MKKKKFKFFPQKLLNDFCWVWPKVENAFWTSCIDDVFCQKFNFVVLVQKKSFWLGCSCKPPEKLCAESVLSYLSDFFLKIRDFLHLRGEIWFWKLLLNAPTRTQTGIIRPKIFVLSLRGNKVNKNDKYPYNHWLEHFQKMELI